MAAASVASQLAITSSPLSVRLLFFILGKWYFQGLSILPY